MSDFNSNNSDFRAPPDVVTFGEAMALLVADQPGPLHAAASFLKRTAGAETNVAIGLARLGFRVSWISRLGDDAMGRYLIGEMQREGIDCSHVECDAAGRTGMMFKGRLENGGDPPIEYYRKGSAASFFSPDHIDVDWLKSARHLHVTGIFPALSASCLATTQRSMAIMRAAGRTISFDPNLRPTLWASPQIMRDTLNELSASADWVLPGLEEGRLLTGKKEPDEIAQFYRDLGAKLVIVKLGPAGAYYQTETSSGEVPGFVAARIVDTVGAGDGFAVGVISALLEGRTASEAVLRGSWIGARAVQVIGDTEGLPTRSELAAASL